MELLSGFKDIVGSTLPFLDSAPAIRAILGFILMFFLPGFAWTLVFFGGKRINIIERLALSFGLSIATVTLGIFALDRLIGVKITGSNAVLVIIAITVIPVAFYSIKRLTGKREDDDVT